MGKIKKIFITIFICLLATISAVVVYAGESGSVGSFDITTTYNWNDYKDKRGSFWIKFYEKMYNNDKGKEHLYEDEWQLLCLAALHSENISAIVGRDENYGTNYDYIDLYKKYSWKTYQFEYHQGENSGISKEIDEEIGNKDEDIIGEREYMHWADLVASVYRRCLYAKFSLPYTKFTEYEIDSMERLYNQYNSNYSFPDLTKKEQEEINEKYEVKSFSFKVYIPEAWNMMKNIIKSYEYEDIGGNGIADESTLGEIISEADKFLSKGDTNVISNENLQAMSNTLYNVIFIVGLILAFIVGGILGIKFMTSGLEGQAEVKTMLVPYVVGCIILFGAFTIWKIVLTILQS